ncbi:hypothetical protein [Natronoglomus mannanivorans]|uniref:Uncharacterized protein n=1 Tax=Natronoglomus mannanivorans TaxID=2979990 RepID=A0AAP3E4F4_9EURY|nr:hypothetical protein [Halobacteria archaeon AArc-xg1-1]
MGTRIPTSGTDWGVKQLAIRISILLVVSGAVYVWRPLFHGVFYRMLNSPGGALVGGLTLLAVVVAFLAPPLDRSAVDSIQTKLTLVGVVLVIGVVLALVVGIPANSLEQRTMAEQTMDGAVEVDEFPAINAENPRIAPRDVADVQTRGSVSYRQYRLGESDIARMEDGRLAWSYPIEPDGFRNSIYENQQGVLMSDMTNMENREIQAFDDQPFAVGEGMLFHRSAEWNLKKTDYWAQYNDDPIEFVHDGDAYMAYPKTGHEWHWTPVPHTTPTWEGVALVHTDGTIEHLSPEQAQESEILAGQRLYPLSNTALEMNSLGYRNGIINQLSVVGAHEGHVEVASLPAGAGNSQPFVIDLADEQLSYVTAMEPHGEDTRGLDEVWFVDAYTGEFQYFATGSETLTGPERAMGIVRSADSRTGWGDNFVVIEPVPVTVDAELWWHSKVVPTDNTDITRNVFVNAHTGEAVEIYDTETVREFLAGGDPEAVEEVGTEPADDPDVAYYIVITGEDGTELDRIPIEPGQNVNIVQNQEDEE